MSLIVGILAPNNCFCQAVRVEHEGKVGIWMPDEMAQKVLADVAELEATKKLVEDLKSSISLRDERITLKDDAIEASEKAEKKAIESLAVAIQAKEEAEKKLKVWYRHPAFWATMGIVITVGLEVGCVKLLQAVE